MDLARPLAVITPTVDGDVLAVLAGADKSFTPGELQRLVPSRSVAGIRKSLTRLSDQGIVTMERAGAAFVYRLNRRHLAAPAIIEIAGLRAQFLDRLRHTLASWATPPAFASLFGSAALGTMRPGSDIDVFVVRPDAADGDETFDDGSSWRQCLTQLQRDASLWTGNDVRVLEMSETEVRHGLAAGDQVLDDIQRDGIPLVGTARFWRA
jgi:hypothetical protein